MKDDDWNERLRRAYMNLYVAARNLKLANEGLANAERNHTSAVEALERLEREPQMSGN